MDKIQCNYIKNESVYILNYQGKKDITNSRDKIIEITDEKEINHGCVIKFGPSSSPILSLKTFKVIVIHLKGHKAEKLEINRGFSPTELLKIF